MAKPEAIRPIDAQDELIRLLVHGDIGTGKTSLAGTAGKGALIVHPPMDHLNPIVGSGAEHWEVKTWTEMWDVLEWYQHEGNTYEWVFLDSISLWQDQGLDELWELAYTRKPARREYGPDKPEYGLNMFRIGEWVRHMVGANQSHFGITAHTFEGPIQDGDETIIKLMPWIQGKGMPSKISGYMNIVGYLEVKERVIRGVSKRRRIMHTQSTQVIYAKDQFTAFGDDGKVVDPTIPKIQEAIAEARAQKAERPRRRRREQ